MPQDNMPTDTGTDSDDLCHWCDTPIGDDGRCTECGRMQTRICFCGHELQPGEDPCPACGTDWHGVVKVRRKKRRRNIQVPDMLRYAAIGVFIAVLAAAGLNSVVGALALKSAANTRLPDSPLERAALAWVTLSRTFGAMLEAIVERLGGAALFLGLGLIGALIGIVVYLRREGGLPHHNHNNVPGEVRRRRRV